MLLGIAMLYRSPSSVHGLVRLHGSERRSGRERHWADERTFATAPNLCVARWFRADNLLRHLCWYPPPQSQSASHLSVFYRSHAHLYGCCKLCYSLGRCPRPRYYRSAGESAVVIGIGTSLSIRITTAASPGSVLSKLAAADRGHWTHRRGWQVYGTSLVFKPRGRRREGPKFGRVGQAHSRAAG